MVKRLRDKRLEICVSDTEYEMILQRMELCKEANLGRYMRRMAIDGCFFVVDDSAIKEMTYEINRIGNNINQIAHRVNTGGEITKKEIEEVKEMIDIIWQFQKFILSEKL